MKEAGLPWAASTGTSRRVTALTPGQRPPARVVVSDAELSDIYAFLQSVASQPKLELPSSTNSENGRRFYRAFGCYECHGRHGQSSVQTGGTRLGPPQSQSRV
jgi:hypothetical protein